MAIRLIGIGDTDCSICLNVMEKYSFEISLLPCGHQFHLRCIELLEINCIKGNKPLVCPICRKEILVSKENCYSHYSFSSSDRLIIRYVEYFNSGICCDCQMVNIEDNQFRKISEDGEHKLYAFNPN